MPCIHWMHVSDVFNKSLNRLAETGVHGGKFDWLHELWQQTHGCRLASSVAVNNGRQTWSYSAEMRPWQRGSTVHPDGRRHMNNLVLDTHGESLTREPTPQAISAIKACRPGFLPRCTTMIWLPPRNRDAPGAATACSPSGPTMFTALATTPLPSVFSRLDSVDIRS